MFQEARIFKAQPASFKWVLFTEIRIHKQWLMSVRSIGRRWFNKICRRVSSLFESTCMIGLKPGISILLSFAGQASVPKSYHWRVMCFCYADHWHNNDNLNMYIVQIESLKRGWRWAYLKLDRKFGWGRGVNSMSLRFHVDLVAISFRLRGEWRGRDLGWGLCWLLLSISKLMSGSHLLSPRPTPPHPSPLMNVRY